MHQIKAANLNANELGPEKYRQKFRKYKKFDNHTFVEFTKDKKDFFLSMFRTKKIDGDFNKLRQLILIEDFKQRMASYLLTHRGDKDIKNVNETEVLSDFYSVMH